MNATTTPDSARAVGNRPARKVAKKAAKKVARREVILSPSEIQEICDSFTGLALCLSDTLHRCRVCHAIVKDSSLDEIRANFHFKCPGCGKAKSFQMITLQPEKAVVQKADSGPSGVVLGEIHSDDLHPSSSIGGRIVAVETDPASRTLLLQLQTRSGSSLCAMVTKPHHQAFGGVRRLRALVGKVVSLHGTVGFHTQWGDVLLLKKADQLIVENP